MPPPLDAPFQIRVEPENAVVLFAAHCDHPRTEAYDQTLMKLVEQYDTVVCDLAQTKMMAPDWLRWLARMTVRARKLGKTLRLVGATAAVRETAGLLGIAEYLQIGNNVAET